MIKKTFLAIYTFFITYLAVPCVAFAAADPMGSIIGWIEGGCKAAGGAVSLIGVIQFALSYANDDGGQKATAIKVIFGGAGITAFGFLLSYLYNAV
jgi:hypothetical protein